jgi:hypothetical protein
MKAISILMCGLTLIGSGFAQQFSFRTFDGKDDLLNTKYSILKNPNYETCGIGHDNAADNRPATIEVFPEQVSAHVGDKVELRFDATTICRGNMVTDPRGVAVGHGNGRLGYIEWEPGAVQSLPDTYGIASYNTGYSQPRTGSILVYINLRCAVPKKNFPCVISRSIPISIVAKGTPLKRRVPHP